MTRKMIITGLITAAAVLYVSAAVNGNRDITIGSTIEEFTMPDPNGNTHRYSELKGENGALLVFLSAQCPVVKMYDQRISTIAAAFKEKGINFVGIYSNHTESVEWVKEHSELTYDFPVLIDKDNVFADKLGATRTPEVYYFNEKDALDYHGAIDNDRSGNNISKNFLTAAISEKLSGKEITEKDTKAFGCSIKRIEKSEAN